VTYLELCQAYVAELGIAGGAAGQLPAAVTGQSGELANVVRWVRDAALDIDNQWLDWRYLWTTYAKSAAANSATLPAADVTMRLWDINAFFYRAPGGTWAPLQYVTRERMRREYSPLNATAGPPSAFTINPDNSLVLNCPADVAYEIKGEGWRAPVRLTANNDTPLIPNSYQRIILCRAAVMYGNKEDAPEIISGMTAEYETLLEKLEADQLEHQSGRRSSTDRERSDGGALLAGWLGG
jgi:hypothetical protein